MLRAVKTMFFFLCCFKVFPYLFLFIKSVNLYYENGNKCLLDIFGAQSCG